MTANSSRRRRVAMAALAIGSVAALTAGCTRPGGGVPWRTTTTWQAPPSTDGHGHTDDDHANKTTTTMDMDHGGGGDHGGAPGSDGHHAGFDHAPTEAQKATAKKLILDTRAAVKRAGLTSVAALQRAGYITIHDEMTGTTHYVSPPFHRDNLELNPNAVEAFAVRGGRVVAAMYVLKNGSTRANIPDVAGNWTMWHDHNLPFGSANPMDNAYYQLAFGRGIMRTTAPMLHVWLVQNNCGPFAGTDTTNMTGSCHTEAEPGTGYIY
jgi:hypothetical protein